MTELAVTIRAASKSDAAEIRAVAQATWRATYAGLIPTDDIERFLAYAYAEDQLLAANERLGAGFLVAVVADRVVGYVMVGPNQAGDDELFALYVLPEWQRQGIGRRLWEAAAEYLQGHGRLRMDLWALADNAPARRFYERQGARPIVERDFPIGEGAVREVGYWFDLIAR